MNRRHVISAAFAALMLGATGASTAQAQDIQNRYTAPQARDARDAGDVLPALRVISIVRNRYPGADVLDARLQRGSTPQYIVTILTREGRRVDVIVDARSGRILGER